MEDCFSGECNIGDFVADAYAYHYKKILNESETPVIAFTDAGAIRASFAKGRKQV